MNLARWPASELVLYLVNRTINFERYKSKTTIRVKAGFFKAAGAYAASNDVNIFREQWFSLVNTQRKCFHGRDDVFYLIYYFIRNPNQNVGEKNTWWLLCTTLPLYYSSAFVRRRIDELLDAGWKQLSSKTPSVPYSRSIRSWQGNISDKLRLIMICFIVFVRIRYTTLCVQP